jgi:hypothetical protein
MAAAMIGSHMFETREVMMGEEEELLSSSEERPRSVTGSQSSGMVSGGVQVQHVTTPSSQPPTPAEATRSDLAKEAAGPASPLTIRVLAIVGLIGIVTPVAAVLVLTLTDPISTPSIWIIGANIFVGILGIACAAYALWLQVDRRDFEERAWGVVRTFEENALRYHRIDPSEMRSAQSYRNGLLKLGHHDEAERMSELLRHVIFSQLDYEALQKSESIGHRA